MKENDDVGRGVIEAVEYSMHIEYDYSCQTHADIRLWVTTSEAPLVVIASLLGPPNSSKRLARNRDYDRKWRWPSYSLCDTVARFSTDYLCKLDRPKDHQKERELLVAAVS